MELKNPNNSIFFFDEIFNRAVLRNLLKKIDLNNCHGFWSVLNTGGLKNVQKEFSEFQVIKLNLALRNAKKIADKVKDPGLFSINSVLKNSYNSTLQTIDNMPEGKGVVIIKQQTSENFEEMFGRAWNHLSTKSPLICIDETTLVAKYIIKNGLISFF